MSFGYTPFTSIEKPMNETPSRREFAQALAVLATAAVVPAAAQEAVQPDTKAYAAAVETVVRYRFGKQLSEEQIKKVQAGFIGRRFSSDALKSMALANGEDPVEAFRADL